MHVFAVENIPDYGTHQPEMCVCLSSNGSIGDRQFWVDHQNIFWDRPASSSAKMTTNYPLVQIQMEDNRRLACAKNKTAAFCFWSKF